MIESLQTRHKPQLGGHDSEIKGLLLDQLLWELVTPFIIF